MTTATREHRKQRGGITIVEDYHVAADAKKRISLRNAKTKYFHVKVLSNGCYLLEPRVLVPPEAIPARTLKVLEQSVANLKKGLASPPIDLAPFQKRGAYQRIKLSALPARPKKPEEPKGWR
jgi:hypothetical protein